MTAMDTYWLVKLDDFIMFFAVVGVGGSLIVGSLALISLIEDYQKGLDIAKKLIWVVVPFVIIATTLPTTEQMTIIKDYKYSCKK